MLAFLGSIYGLIGEYVQIQPDFEERKLEEMHLQKGRSGLFTLLFLHGSYSGIKM